MTTCASRQVKLPIYGRSLEWTGTDESLVPGHAMTWDRWRYILNTIPFSSPSSPKTDRRARRKRLQGRCCRIFRCPLAAVRQPNHNKTSSWGTLNQEEQCCPSRIESHACATPAAWHIIFSFLPSDDSNTWVTVLHSLDMHIAHIHNCPRAQGPTGFLLLATA